MSGGESVTSAKGVDTYFFSNGIGEGMITYAKAGDGFEVGFGDGFGEALGECGSILLSILELFIVFVASKLL